MSRKNHSHKPRWAGHATEYIMLPNRPDLLRIIAEPNKTIYINGCADWWSSAEQTIVSPDDPLLVRIIGRQHG